MRRSTIIRAGATSLMLFLAAACGRESAPPSEEAPGDTTAAGAPADTVGRSYERVFAFVAEVSDTTVLVPVFFTARPGGGQTVRRIQGWLGRGESWEPFVEERWRAAGDHPAWRIVPRGPVRLVVGADDAIETILYREPPRVLELDLGEGLVEWTGPAGGVYRVEEARLLLGNRSFGGVAVELARSWSSREAPGGDWAFLVSGDSLQVVLQSPRQTEPGVEGAWRGYARLDFRQLQWPDVTVEWSDRQAYEPARRDVPAAWRFRSTGEEIRGSLESVSARLEVEEGTGPVLPVSALFGVQGTVAVEGSEYPVRGLVRHRRE